MARIQDAKIKDSIGAPTPAATGTAPKSFTRQQVYNSLLNIPYLMY